MARIRHSLLGVHEELDRAVRDLAFFGVRYQDFHPAAAGDVSQVFSKETSKSLAQRFRQGSSRWFEMRTIEELASIRNDGRTGYRSEGVASPNFYELTKHIGGRVLLITRSGSQIPAIAQTLQEGEDGKLLNVVEVNKKGDAIRILYGNREFGSIPSIELHIHLLAGAASISQRLDAPATVHAHPYNLIRLGMEKKIEGEFAAFNAVIYTQTEGLNRIDPDLVGVVPYVPSGSARLVDISIELLQRHRLLLWMNHGFVVRSTGIERGYAVMSYADRCAKAALNALRHDSVGLPTEFTEDFLRQNNLLDAHRRLKLRSHQSS